MHTWTPMESHFCFQQQAWAQAPQGRGLILFLPALQDTRALTMDKGCAVDDT